MEQVSSQIYKSNSAHNNYRLRNKNTKTWYRTIVMIKV